MKAIFVFTAALMTGASIYGLASYKNLSNTKDFKELYAERKEVNSAEPLLIDKKPEKKEPAIAVLKKVEEPGVAKKKTNKKTISVRKQGVKKQRNENKLPATKVSKETTNKSQEPVKKVKKLNRKMFSRAALKDE